MSDNSNKTFWQRFAFLYSPFMRQNKIQYTAVYGLCRKHLDKSMDMLELACGTGQFSRFLAQDVNSLEATDFSEKMVKNAAKKIKAQNVNFSVKDATALSYADGTFDGVFIANALHIMPSPEAALKEIYRVLKPDGKLFAPTFVYDKVADKRKLKLMEKLGFKTFHKWQGEEFAGFTSQFGFDILERTIVDGKLLSECVLIACKEKHKQPVEVVAALIWDNGKFLICQRPAHKARGLLWEFVGGKVEVGETKKQAIVRECNEEFAITVEPHDIFMEVTHEYPDIFVRLTLFNCSILQGQPQLLEHNDMKWITPEEISNYNFCPADEEILKSLRYKKSLYIQ